MRLEALLVLSAVIAACGGYAPQLPELLREDAVAVAELARWETAHGELRQCRAELPSLRWETAPADVLSQRCVTSMALVGCFSYEGPEPQMPTITLAEGYVRESAEHYRVWRHELTHWLLHCSEIDETGDPEHRGPWWMGLL